MDCKSCRNHLSEYLDGTLGRRRSAQVRAHLQVCAGCHTDFEALQQLLEVLKTSAVPAPRPDFWPRFWTLVHTRRAGTQEAGRPVQARYRWGGLAIACGLLLVAASIDSYRISYRASSAPRPQASSATRLSHADGRTLSQIQAPKKHSGGTRRRTRPAISLDALIALHVGESAADPLSDSGRLHYLNAESEQADLKFDGKLDIR